MNKRFCRLSLATAGLFLSSCAAMTDFDYEPLALPDDADVLADIELLISRRHNEDQVRSGEYERGSDGGSERWFQRTVNNPDGSTNMAWADTTSCPGAAEAFEAVRTVEIPTLNEPEWAEEVQSLWSPIYIEGTYYTFETEAWFSDGHTARIAITGPTPSPIGQWSVAMLTALEDCWSDSVPEVSSQP